MAMEHALACVVVVMDEPLTHHQAMNSAQSQWWIQAEQAEFKAHKQTETWEVVDRPKNRSIIDSKWVYKIKQRANGSIERYKAKLIAKEFTQRPEYDFDETFSFVVRYESLRLLFALSARRGWRPQQCDVKTAFLHGNLTEEIYMELAPGQRQSNKVVRLRKCIYELKQAEKEWYSKLTKFFADKGFTFIHFDSCVFIHKTEKLIISVYVDDLAFYGSNKPKIANLINELAKEFQIVSFGNAIWLLGIHIQYSDKRISLFQNAYIEKLLQRYGMDKSNLVSILLTENIKLSKGSIKQQIEDPIHYQSIISSIMYAIIGTRFDLTFAIIFLSQYNSCPNTKHLTVAKHVLRRFNGIKDFKLFYPNIDELTLEKYCDVFYASCPNTRRSYFGNVFRLKNATITWKAQKQKNVTKSTTKTKYVTLSLTSGQTIWLKRALKELRYDVPCAIFTNNIGAQNIVENSKINERTKHIDVAYHYTKEKLLKKKFHLFHIEFKFNFADFLTKPLKRLLNNKHIKLFIDDIEKKCWNFQPRSEISMTNINKYNAT